MKRFRAVAAVAALALLSGIIALSGITPAGAGQFPELTAKSPIPKS
ncbi:MAG: hypothetical protein WCK41_00440 [Actinomycetes bacterium]